MQRGKKIMAALVLLGMGLGTALLFRRAPTSQSAEQSAAPPKETLVLRESGSATGASEQPIRLEPSSVLRRADQRELPIAAPPSSTLTPPALPLQFDRSLASTPLETTATKPQTVSAVEQPKSVTVEVPQGTEPLRTHRIVDGDTLARLAERFLGDPQRFAEIHALNVDQLPNPNVLPIGVELKLPPRSGTLVLKPVNSGTAGSAAEQATGPAVAGAEKLPPVLIDALPPVVEPTAPEVSDSLVPVPAGQPHD